MCSIETRFFITVCLVEITHFKLKIVILFLNLEQQNSKKKSCSPSLIRELQTYLQWSHLKHIWNNNVRSRVCRPFSWFVCKIFSIRQITTLRNCYLMSSRWQRISSLLVNSRCLVKGPAFFVRQPVLHSFTINTLYWTFVVKYFLQILMCSVVKVLEHGKAHELFKL